MPGTAPPPAGPEPARQRLDKWLWFTRVVKTRSLAARLVTEGHVRVNSVRVETAAKAVKPGDVVTVALERHVRVLKVLSSGERRGPAPEARTLYEDLAPRPAATPGDDAGEGPDDEAEADGTED
ncbi:RNA-binding S4 domain-containing protein [Lichenibacterium ramalinae]|uniref:RNA-binding S4 domain-containing protein n=1 Tax=Lichenibacterium ramalinae TaxID=2316527 RepID=A0A4Q2RGN8_9HYPH|nr:RNA-binding S4 domain-containing protein [Lichenibacterium ramalinae]